MVKFLIGKSDVVIFYMKFYLSVQKKLSLSLNEKRAVSWREWLFKSLSGFECTIIGTRRVHGMGGIG